MPHRQPSICYVVPETDLVPGTGHTRRALSLARALSARARVTLVFRRLSGRVSDEPFAVTALEPGLPGVGGDCAPQAPALGSFVEQRCRGSEVVLEGSWSMPGRISAWCGRRGVAAIPIVDRLPADRWRAPLDTGRRWLALGSTDRYLRRAAMAVAASEELKARIAERWGLAADRIRVIGPAVDRARFLPKDQAEARQRLGFSPEHRILLAGGALDSAHDLTPLVEAVQRVGDPRLRLLVLGDGAGRAVLEAAARPGTAVTFAGRVPDDLLTDYLAAADLCVAIEDRRNPFETPLADAALLPRECLAAGRAVAVASGGERHALIRHLISGFLLERDLLAWIRFLQRDCPSRNILRVMGQAAAATPLDGVDQAAAAYLEIVARVQRSAGETAASV